MNADKSYRGISPLVDQGFAQYAYEDWAEIIRQIQQLEEENDRKTVEIAKLRDKVTEQSFEIDGLKSDFEGCLSSEEDLRDANEGLAKALNRQRPFVHYMEDEYNKISKERDQLKAERDDWHKKFGAADKQVAKLNRMVSSIGKERDHWRANHDEQVRKNKVLRDRPDLPVERLEGISGNGG